MKAVFLGLLGGFAMLCQPIAHADMEAAQVSLIEGGEAVFYRGEMDTSAIVQVENLLKNAPEKIKRLVIDSGGGDVNLGMDLAGLVLENNLDVVVERLCASSCANYVFPAGKTKRIKQDAVVVWHGSAIQEGLEKGPGIDDIRLSKGAELSVAEKQKLLDEALKDNAQYIADIKKRQAELYKRLGIDARVTVMGQQLKAAEEWTLSPADMAYFGIHNVTAQADYGQAMPASMKERGVRLLRLQDYPAYKLAR